MTRLALLLALPLVACGDDAVTTGSATTTGPDTSSTGTTTGTAPTTGELPTTGGAASSSGSASASDGSSSTTTATSSTSATTEGIDASSSSTTGDPDTTSTGASSTTGDESSSSSSSDSSTGDASTGEVVVPPMPAGLCNNGQGPLTSFAEPMPQAEELHIVGVYQATGNAITVTVNRVDVPLTLVLSSYEPVAFTLVLAPGVLLEHVILNGYNPHTVQGQGAAMVTDLSDNFDYLAACAYVWPDDDQGCDTPGLVTGAEALTGLELTTFVGCYEGISFTLD